MASNLRRVLVLTAMMAVGPAIAPTASAAVVRSGAKVDVVKVSAVRPTAAKTSRHARAGKRAMHKARRSGQAEAWNGGGWEYYRYEPIYRFSPNGSLLWSSYPYPGGDFVTGSVRRPFGYDTGRGHGR